MHVDRFYGLGRDPFTTDAGADAYNARPPLSEAWRYPTRERGELEAEIRRIVGPDATFETQRIVLRATVARCDAGAPERWAHALAALDTRVRFLTVAPNTDGSMRFEAIVWLVNPHGRPGGTPRSPSTLRWEPGDGVDSAACPCGAQHVAFYGNKKAQAGDEFEPASTPCLACGRATLTLFGVSNAARVEFYLLDGVPFDRLMRLRSDRAWRRIPRARRVAAQAVRVARELWGPALFLVVVLLVLRQLLRRG